MAEQVNPHVAREPVIAGAGVDDAAIAAVLVHGRDQDAEYMKDFFARLGRTDTYCVLPEADERSWYPGRFYDPVEQNEPWVTGALEALDAAIDKAAAQAGSRPVALIGFSQGGCLVAEYLARTGAERVNAAAVLTGALIGIGASTRWVPTSLSGLPMLVASSRTDSWVPLVFVEQTAELFQRAGAEVRVQVTDDREHRINGEMDKAVGELLDALVAGA